MQVSNVKVLYSVVAVTVAVALYQLCPLQATLCLAYLESLCDILLQFEVVLASAVVQYLDNKQNRILQIVLDTLRKVTSNVGPNSRG